MPRKSHQAFTLIELLVVIAIIAILASLAYPVFTSVLEKAHVTQDLNNLRQIGLGMQTYLNDNDGAYFPPNTDWMQSLHSKYISTWKSFQSPFDERPASEAGATAPASYGFNFNALTGSAPLLSDKITNPTLLILFAPAQPFSKYGTATNASVSKSNVGPGGANAGGTHNSGLRINASFADLHVENMPWTTFKADSNSPPNDPCGTQRWNPLATCP